MLSYELAEQLYKAGFGNNGIGDRASIPTLSELIEACGYSFNYLKLGTKQIGENELSDWWYCTAKVDKGELIPIMDGKTPEEAVAKLWLALNKKQ